MDWSGDALISFIFIPAKKMPMIRGFFTDTANISITSPV